MPAAYAGSAAAGDSPEIAKADLEEVPPVATSGVSQANQTPAPPGQAGGELLPGGVDAISQVERRHEVAQGLDGGVDVGPAAAVGTPDVAEEQDSSVRRDRRVELLLVRVDGGAQVLGRSEAAIRPSLGP